MLQSRIVSVLGHSPLSENSELGIFIKGLLTNLGYLGFTLRTSGTEQGIESLAVSSYLDLMSKGVVSPARLKICRPYIKYTNCVPYKQCYVTINSSNYQHCSELVKSVTPYWRGIGNQSKYMHSKNALVMFGEQLNTPSTFLIVYDEPDVNGIVKGFSSSAIGLAKNHKIPVFNFASDDVTQTIANLKQFLHNYGIPINQFNSTELQ
ncbi:DprA-like DNA recombination-mediator protein [Acinetobacter phage vB_AbaM_ME3]|uniref:DNA recombination-mediator protein A n=1 Tax=Acinetobacter phage vB_AbaM_ME3 TaxID=1837876 RepID=A0A172Q0U5_9CAUD|nr:DprA-like DNA recombination-mediator protein [Acinetobacter phage vB_AbaM_ME3]AND75472.1 hypothetical protein ME3_311 [Acinetobacter phage vB_AbaM_ME3]